jgi:hypothetical protein
VRGSAIRYPTLLLVVILSNFFCLVVYAENQNMNEILKNFKIEYQGAKGWHLKKKTAAELEGKNRISADFENESSEKFQISLLSHVSEAEFKSIYRSEFSDIKNLFKTSLTPYAGDISNKQVCEEYFLPKEKSVTLKLIRYNTLTVMASERMGFGVCSEDLIAFDCMIAAAFVNQEKYLKISFCVPHKKNKMQSKRLMEHLTMLDFKK